MIQETRFRNKKKSGFSLIELIVTVTIIAVLTVVATVSFGATNKKARDSRRMADLEKIRIGLEMAKQVGGTYPANGSEGTLVTAGYMPVYPTDPKSGQNYFYTRPSLYTYSLCAIMEDLGSTTPNDPVGTCGSNCGAPCNYMVTNP